MKNMFMKYAVLFFLFFYSINVFSQILISDESTGIVADPSAVLEVKSTSKGLLIPRLTTSQRNLLSSSAKEGLLIYDSDLGSFFLYGKTSLGTLGWNDLSTPSGIWETNLNNVYLSSPYTNVGIGTSSPNKKLVIKAQNDNDTLFEILDKDNKPLMIITPTLTKFYFNQNAKGIAGGFAVGRYATAKSVNDSALFLVTPDSTRVYTSGIASTVEAGGFAVGRYATAKGGNAKKYFFTGIDSTRVYTDGSGKKGIAGGFAVGRYATAKTGAGTYMSLVPDNYFIGDRTGEANTTGLYNQFFGFESGVSNTYGNENIFSGYQSGYKNIGGSNNVFLGYQTGYNNTSGNANTFVGYQCGYSNSTGSDNSFFGNSAGYSNSTGTGNTFIGTNTGLHNTSGSSNTFVGDNCGVENTTSINNTFIGTNSGLNNTSGSNNTFIGPKAGYTNSTGVDNTFIGLNAGAGNTVGKQNTFIGNYAGYANTTGGYGVAIGNQAGRNSTGGYNVLIGSGAGYNVSLGSNVFIGTSAGYYSTTASSNIFIGQSSGYQNTEGDYNVFLGYNAGLENTKGWGGVYLGYEAGKNMTGTFGSNNIFIGTWAAQNKTSGQNNVFIGGGAGANNLSGYNGVFIGANAGANETGHRKLYIESADTGHDKTESLIYGEFDNDILRFNGNVGINVDATVDFHIENNADATIILQADADNSGENDNPRIELRQDGDIVNGGIGFVGDAGEIYTNSLNNSMYLVNSTSYPLQLGTNNTARLSIEAGGDVGIGTINPSHKFEVEGYNSSGSGTPAFIAKFTNTGGNYSDGIEVQAGHIYASDNTQTIYNDIIYVNCVDGNGTYVGSLYSHNGTVQIGAKSANKSKDNTIRKTNQGLNIIKKLNVVDYDLNFKTNTYKTGFVGQDVLNVFPAMVSYEEKSDEYSVANSALVPILTKAMQEQQIQIEELIKANDELKKIVNELEDTIKNK